MASTLVEFGHADGRDVCMFSSFLKDFLEQMVDRKYWGGSSDHFGPIWYVGSMCDPRDGTYSIAISVWADYADTLFWLMDEFLRTYDTNMEYERNDKR